MCVKTENICPEYWFLHPSTITTLVQCYSQTRLFPACSSDSHCEINLPTKGKNINTIGYVQKNSYLAAIGCDCLAVAAPAIWSGIKERGGKWLN
jgi:hypothetical protein